MPSKSNLPSSSYFFPRPFFNPSLYWPSNLSFPSQYSLPYPFLFLFLYSPSNIALFDSLSYSFVVPLSPKIIYFFAAFLKSSISFDNLDWIDLLYDIIFKQRVFSNKPKSFPKTRFYFTLYNILYIFFLIL